MDNHIQLHEEFNQIVETLKVQIPYSIEETTNKLNGLGGLLTAGDWARAAFVRAWVRPTSGGRPKKSDENSPLLTIEGFASLEINGLKTRDSVRHYWQAWEATGKPAPTIGETIDLPGDPFPEWESKVNAHRTYGTGENEWFTPEKYIKAAREVMGDIDLDPATSDAAQKRIKASNYFTVKENGLIHEWVGRIWLNPPYSQPFIQQFAEKTFSEIQSGKIVDIIILTHNYTDTAWFHLLNTTAKHLCFTRGRIAFEKQDGTIAAPTQGQCFFFQGKHDKEFKEVFSKYGFIR